MRTASIAIRLDVIEYVRLGGFTAGKALAMNRLDLEAVIPAFHGGVVVAVALLAHAAHEAVIPQ